VLARLPLNAEVERQQHSSTEKTKNTMEKHERRSGASRTAAPTALAKSKNPTSYPQRRRKRRTHDCERTGHTPPPRAHHLYTHGLAECALRNSLRMHACSVQCSGRNDQNTSRKQHKRGTAHAMCQCVCLEFGGVPHAHGGVAHRFMAMPTRHPSAHTNFISQRRRVHSSNHTSKQTKTPRAPSVPLTLRTYI